MKTIVIAEDEYFVRCGIANGIDWKQHGFQIAGAAENGEQALILIRRYLPEVLITDIRMPVMDGLSLIREAKKIKPAIKIIILTAYSDFEYAQEAIQLGVNDYVLKLSARPDDILQRIQALFQPETPAEPPSTAILYDRPYTVAAIRILNGDAVQERQKRTVQCVKYLQDQCGGQENICLDCLEDGVAYLVCFLSQEKLAGQADRLIRFMRDTYELDLMVGMSLGWNGKDDLPEGERSAREACDYNFYQNSGRAVVYREGMLLPFQFKTSENEVRKAMESRSQDDLYGILDGLLEKLRFTPVSDCKSACIDFLYQVVSCLRNSGRAIPHHLETVDKMAAYIGRLDTFQELAQEMRDSLDALYQLSVKELDDYRSVVYKMKVAIDRNFPMALDLGFFAQSLHMSYSYLSTLFKNEIGMTFKEYLNLVRIQNACELLKKRNCSVSEAAELVGYSNPYYFSKVFKKNTGYSPAEYRNRFDRA